MKILRIGFALCMGVLGGMLMAQSAADFPSWMASVSKSNGAIKGALKGGDLKAATAEAANLEKTFATVEAFFTKGKMTDAADKAKAAKESAAATAKATTLEAATAAYTVGASCGGCHMAHRGDKGADGHYAIK